MGLSTGIYIFYASNRENTRGQPDLYWLLFDGAKVVHDRKVDLGSLKCGRGVSAILINDTIFVHMTCNDNKVYQLLFDGQNCRNAGAIPGRSPYLNTTDRTATLLDERSLKVFAKDSSGAKTLKRYEEAASRWSSTDVLDQQGKAFGFDYGPGVVNAKGRTYVFFSEYEKQNLKGLVYSADGRIEPMSPPHALLNYCPSPAVLGEQIYVLHHGHRNDGRLFCSQTTLDGKWQSDYHVSGATLNDDPGVCVWGDRIFCFFQQKGQMFGTAFVGNKWLSKYAPIIKGRNETIGNCWYGPCPVAVAGT